MHDLLESGNAGLHRLSGLPVHTRVVRLLRPELAQAQPLAIRPAVNQLELQREIAQGAVEMHIREIGMARAQNLVGGWHTG